MKVFVRTKQRMSLFKELRYNLKPCSSSPQILLYKYVRILSIPRYAYSLRHFLTFMKTVMNFFRIFLLCAVFSIAFSDEKLSSHLLPRPLVVENLETVDMNLKQSEEEVQLQCTSWRFTVEANNLSPWKTIPTECADYVKDYMTGRAYRLDIERVSKEAETYAKSVELSGNGTEIWVFDIDETLLSNLPYYAEHGYGLEVFNIVEFDKWVEKAMAPAIEASLKLYEQVMKLGFKVFLLTGRSENLQNVTAENLRNVGFHDWDKLILRGFDDYGKQATIYKSKKRSEMEKEGYRIIGNSGDQWSDLLGSAMSIRSFKVPNLMYYIP